MTAFWVATTILCALGWFCMWTSRNNQRWRADAAERKLRSAVTRAYQLEQQNVRSGDEDELWQRAQANDPDAQAELEARMFSQMQAHLAQQERDDGWYA